MRFEDVQNGYVNLFRKMQVDLQRAQVAENVAKTIHVNKQRYQHVAALTNVPWYWIGIIHMMESECDFSTHLHNGDALSGRTVNRPANRPVKGNPPFRWEDSAIDALELKGLLTIDDWSLSRILFEFERYNGFGYFGAGINSPYLWSFSNLYKRGKYVEDGDYDASFVSKQCGAAVILKAMEHLKMIDGWPETARASDVKPAAKHVTKIDEFLGGEWLAGKKTILGIVAYVLVHIADNLDVYPLLTNDLFMSYFDTVITGWIGLAALSKGQKWVEMISDALQPKQG
jgi:lysozyme family protein